MGRTWLMSVLVAGVLGGCVGEFGKRPTYTYFVETLGGNCTGTVAIDSARVRISEEGCEERTSGWTRDRVSAETLAEIERLFAAFPDPHAEPLHCEDSEDTIYRLTLTRSDGTSSDWYFCPEDGRFPSPFAEALEAMALE